MRKIRYGFIALFMLMCTANTALAGVSIGIGIGLPNVSIGINLPLYPELVPIPGYPVYYAPGMDSNYFFYDGMYWVYQNDMWYASSWYNGPWGYVNPSVVPLFVLRVPVGYYRQPPLYFSGWQSNAAPHWGEHWGRSWEQRRGGWDRWNRSSAPSRAPLPAYQRQYVGAKYPGVEQQHALRGQNYRYQPRDKVVSQHFKEIDRRAPAGQRGRQEKPQARPQQQDIRQSAPHQQGAQDGQRQQPQHQGGENVQRSAPAQPDQQQRGPAGHQQRKGDEQRDAGQEHGQRQGDEQRGGGQEHQQRQGDEQRGGGQEHGQGQNREEGRGGHR